MCKELLNCGNNVDLFYDSIKAKNSLLLQFRGDFFVNFITAGEIGKRKIVFL